VVKQQGVVIKVRVRELVNPGLGLKEDKHHFISEYQNMALKISK